MPGPVRSRSLISCTGTRLSWAWTAAMLVQRGEDCRVVVVAVPRRDGRDLAVRVEAEPRRRRELVLQVMQELQFELIAQKRLSAAGALEVEDQLRRLVAELFLDPAGDLIDAGHDLLVVAPHDPDARPRCGFGGERDRACRLIS